jgi:hypothetical protein
VRSPDGEQSLGVGVADVCLWAKSEDAEILVTDGRTTCCNGLLDREQIVRITTSAEAARSTAR